MLLLFYLLLHYSHPSNIFFSFACFIYKWLTISHRFRMKAVVLLLVCAIVAMSSASFLYNPLLYKFGGLGYGGLGFGGLGFGGLGFGGLGFGGLGLGLGKFGLLGGLYGGFPYKYGLYY